MYIVCPTLLRLFLLPLFSASGYYKLLLYMYVYNNGTYGVILRIVKAGCHPVAIVEH